ncbi:uncharacterized protein [Oscarella lobularis]|uniref:uncharacterized protein n=1 Tax=Oscarella lobularis TaxID=121494 RepID=UPI0033134D84
MTCNPNWQEITSELLPGQTPKDRHDLIARVLRLKVETFMYLVDTQNIYGIKRCHVYTIECRKIRPDQIDSIISAELPDPNEDPALFGTITKHMIHGPCGQLNPRSPFMKDGQCTKHYPRTYLNKGKDKAVVGLANRHRNDEITRYQIAKYISTNEGVWRMLQFPIHDHFPAVEQLQVHLEKYQRTLFNVENAPDRSIYTVHPKNTECYLLRLLLLHVRGPTSFADLRRVDDTVFNTYAEACRERGLLADVRHWHLALTEATVTDRPYKIGEICAIMLHMCEISYPLRLWEQHKEAMAQDFLRTLRRRANDDTLSYTDAIFNRALLCIENKLLSFPGGKPLSDYHLPSPDRSSEQDDDTLPREIAAEYSYNTAELQERLTTNEGSLTQDQRHIYEELLAYVA